MQRALLQQITITNSKSNQSEIHSWSFIIASVSKRVLYSYEDTLLKYLNKQVITLEKYNGKPTYRIGINVVESLVTSSNDTSLLDNAQGTTNENSRAQID